jgi:hypothetical protein
MAPAYAKKVLKLLPKLDAAQRRSVIEEIEELAEQADLFRRQRRRAEVVARTSGALKNLRASSDDFIREKQRELEERKWRG